jgi:chemotaxis protein histidine kinase CheA
MSEEVVAEQVEEQNQEEVLEETQEETVEEPESFMDSLFQDLGLAQDNVEKSEEPEPEEENEIPPQETTEVISQGEDVPEDEASQDEPEEKPKKKVTYKAPKVDYEEIRRTVREEVSKQQPTPQPPTPQQQAAEPEPAEDDLVPEQLEELELARFAEKKYPDKYKGQAKKLLTFYKKLDDYAASADEDRTFDEDDSEFVDFVQKNKPKITNQKRLEREMIADLAAQQVSTEKEAEIADLKEKMRVLETKPTVEKKFSKFTQDLQKAGEQEDEFSASIYEQQLTQAENMGKEYLDLYYGMKTFNGNEPSQKWIVDFVTHQSNVFQQKGGKYLSREGKTFMTPADFAARGNPSSNWTFGPDDVLQMFNNFFTNTAKKQVESEYSRLEKMGFTKAKAKNSAKKGKVKEEATPITAPKAKTAKSPGAAESGETDDTSFGEELVKTLGMDFTPTSTG